MDKKEFRTVVEEIARVALEREDISKYISKELDLADWYLDQVYKVLEEKLEKEAV